MEKLSKEFYLQNNVVSVAKQLLGKIITVNNKKQSQQFRIVETEAYRGYDDKACHASNGMTNRNKVMFKNGGICYVYLCYGIHHLFNVVTNTEGNADAVLIRAVEPLVIETVNTNGPGKWTKEAGITTELNGADLLKKEIFISEEDKSNFRPVVASKRIGVEYAGEHALRLWRFYFGDSDFVSKKFKQDKILINSSTID
ncbi:DNA-3-methyladenine glycosylase [Marinigracilibium pacificum]|uniref:Putative 3-methyladenine DNA glycosylase n=1 Tax=Marinigracilibium pacificum TaxID=2729599 RepID=A0A848IVM6_9BACT|nr:DNA-3-methyladenine glycosylase [Marinigracilibium pacificum]NMM48387.1 DNA-3-methyladenine glycosylase [Marinigracilibium pacificum]